MTERTRTEPTVARIKIVTIVDDWPDLSHLGEFRDEPGPPERTIDRYERGIGREDQYRYFVATHGPEETGNDDSVEEDWERMEAYGDEWWSLGVRAVAKIVVADTIQTIESGGLWGVESDAPDDYLREVAREELDHLETILDELGLDVPDECPIEPAVPFAIDLEVPA